MNILVIGGTRLMGKHLVEQLLSEGHKVTIATRGKTNDSFADSVNRIIFDRLEEDSIKENLTGRYFDVVYDSLNYCSNDTKHLLEHISCDRYIMISTISVYDLHTNTKESDFDPMTKELIWCDRDAYPYGEIKRQAECALFQQYQNVKPIAVRFPLVIGEDDYTKRLYFYVDHILRQIPMYIDNYEAKIPFISSKEAGQFLAWLSTTDYVGPINGACEGTISIKEIVEYIEEKTGKVPILSSEGEAAPYNGPSDYSINTELANRLGFQFSSVKTWIYSLIDQLMKEIG